MSARGGRARRGGLALGIITLGLAVLWLGSRADRSSPARTQEARPEPVPVRARLPGPVPVGAADAGLLRLRATLLPLRVGEAFRGRALVGPAFVDEADRQEWESQRGEPGEGAGPRRLEDLANVAEWLPAEVTPDPAGGGRLGPVPVPVAPRYRILAWEEGGAFYWGDFIPPGAPVAGELDAGSLSATLPTGVRLRLRRAPPGQVRYTVRLERVVEPGAAERISDLLPAIRQMAPALASALQEGVAIPAPAEGGVLAPLLPDRAVRVILSTAIGQEGEPVEVPLEEQRIVTAEIDLDRILPGASQALIDLRGRVLLGEGSLAPEGASIERAEPPGADGQVLGSGGTFSFGGLPTWRPSRFVVMVPRAAGGRPVAPPRTEFELTPGPDLRGAQVEVTWRVPAYRWLVLRLDPFARAELEGAARPPYPVFLLQRWSGPGGWRVQAADEFLREGDSVAVSIARPGTYRVLAATSPYSVHEGPGVELSERDAERVVFLRLGSGGRPCEIHVTSASTGQPVHDAPVIVSGPYGSLPPVRGRTDVEGRFRLGRVQVAELHVEVGRQGGTPQAREGARACQESGVIDIRL